MQPLRRVTPATVDVLETLIGEPEPVWGLLVVSRTGRPAGSVYPILERLESLEWVTSEWELDSGRSGPRRRLYRLTPGGLTAARAAVDAHLVRMQRRRAAAEADPARVPTGPTGLTGTTRSTSAAGTTLTPAGAMLAVTRAWGARAAGAGA
ncbi:PadR family transcriptional regulator [Microbacterium sp. cf332]|uniref:PadR family transcriptional regulator n=1 Tax=Microbacterium sp. cf332 TaxID=1761804 RepID=UPI0008805EF7|nr:helix-turn-helix transcriptional regulator [Microbacterium sp. cf332]SDQ94211.1 Transcriptional regulator PadR-like family protein [Microbacterium sp. cf332]